MKSQIEQINLESEIAHNEYKDAINKTQWEIESLVLELDKLFINIRHYENSALPAANSLISSSIAKYKNEEIEFEEYFNNLQDALNIKSSYNDIVNQYNQTAIKLELYSN